MIQNALRKSKFMKKRYQIDSFPIPIWQIEQAIIDQGFDIVIASNICKSCIIRSTVYIPDTVDCSNRVFLSHELGHILCHNCDTYRLDPITKKRLEIQADAFSVYFLIPLRRFKKDSKIYNNYELSELYGVPVEFIDSCVKRYLAN